MNEKTFSQSYTAYKCIFGCGTNSLSDMLLLKFSSLHMYYISPGLKASELNTKQMIVAIQTAEYLTDCSINAKCVVLSFIGDYTAVLVTTECSYLT
jgi:hypothetical protein